MWVTTDDLPRGSLEPDEIAVSSVLLTVSAKGRVSNCTVSSPSQRPELDQLACKLMMKRGRYEPAVDADGNRVESTDLRRVRWQVPKDRR